MYEAPRAHNSSRAPVSASTPLGFATSTAAMATPTQIATNRQPKSERSASSISLLLTASATLTVVIADRKKKPYVKKLNTVRFGPSAAKSRVVAIRPKHHASAKPMAGSAMHVPNAGHTNRKICDNPSLRVASLAMSAVSSCKVPLRPLQRCLTSSGRRARTEQCRLQAARHANAATQHCADGRPSRCLTSPSLVAPRACSRESKIVRAFRCSPEHNARLPNPPCTGTSAHASVVCSSSAGTIVHETRLS
mmetsp:Transcript_82152/g.236047  ORF Transcript_82152/g.236047 Transcript_82152/m.236047 type:complete len:250 (+) Transcript_82152:515-1264(+)